MSDSEQEESPNKEIDRAIKKMLKEIGNHPADVQVKIINSAVGWEKCKHAITDKVEDFDPDGL
jgi:hypothetical protein